MFRRMIYVVLVMMLGLVPMNPIYGDDPGSPSLLAWWTFDEESGDIVGDASGNGNDGTLEEGPTFVDGQFGQALAFDGSRVAIGASDSLTTDLFQGSFTLTAWINPTQTGNTWQQIFRSIRADDNPNDTLFINNGGKLSWRGRVGGSWAGGMCETAPHVVPADHWTHVAVTGDGTNFRIYVNGALSEETAFQTTGGENSTYYIGGDPIWTGEFYTGMIDDVRIYNMALTGLEILVAMEGISAPAVADIILVTEAIDWDLDGLRDDHSLESFLVSEGHSVDVRPDYWKVLTPDKIAELNEADLIIFSRLAWSDRYDEGNETTDWNSIRTPLLQMNAYFARNIRWKWVNSGTHGETEYIDAMAMKPNHPVFWGVPLNVYDSTVTNDVVQMIDPLVGTGLTSFIGGIDMGNGQLIAMPLGAEMGWIAEWNAGVEFFEGSGQYAGGRRMLFCAGTQEIEYYDYDRQEVIKTAQGELNLTAEGLQMFRNAIDHMRKREFTPNFTEGEVEDFETNDFSQFPWNSFGDEIWDTTRSERLSGNYSARSGSIEDGEESSLEVSIDCVSGHITFYCKISSESGYDKLTFYIDGLEQGTWSGQEDWAEVSFYVREGIRTFKWAYSKDSSISEGDDTVWIDDIVFPIGP